MSYTSIKKSRVTVKRFVLMVYMPRQISQFSKAKKKDHHLWVGSSICLCVKENFGKTGMINATGVQMKLSVCSVCKIAHIATSKRSLSFAAHSPRWGAGRHPVEAWSPSQVCVAGWSLPKQHPRSPTVLWSSQKGGRNGTWEYGGKTQTWLDCSWNHSHIPTLESIPYFIISPLYRYCISPQKTCENREVITQKRPRYPQVLSTLTGLQPKLKICLLFFHLSSLSFCMWELY